jgi:hypothetical protein
MALLGPLLEDGTLSRVRRAGRSIPPGAGDPFGISCRGHGGIEGPASTVREVQRGRQASGLGRVDVLFPGSRGHLPAW